MTEYAKTQEYKDYLTVQVRDKALSLQTALQNGQFAEALRVVANIESQLVQIVNEELTARDYEQALQFYDGACNSGAAFHELHRLTHKLKNWQAQEYQRTGAEADYRKHPIVRLYLAQLNWLAGLGSGQEGGAEDEARKIVEQLKAPDVVA